MCIIIGITGKARCGKDTAAMHLVQQHGFVQLRFADALKNGLMSMIGLTNEQLEGEEKEKVIDWLGKSPRELMQTLGTEWGRHMVNNNLWVNCMQRTIDELKLLKNDINFVISDVRFENEANYIRERGRLLHLKRKDREQVNEHVSEQGVAFRTDDYLLTNDQSITTLHKKLDDFVHAIILTRAQAI